MSSVNVTCHNQNEVLLMRAAKYGRMKVGTCVKQNLGYIGCVTDVLGHLDELCSGRQACEIKLPDQDLFDTRPCPEDTRPYLSVSYQCVKGKLLFFCFCFCFFFVCACVCVVHN